MSDRKRVLVVEDDENVRTSLAALLQGAGYEVVEANGVDAARKVIASQTLHAAVLDRYLGNLLGTDLIAELRQTQPGIVIAIVSGDPTHVAAADIRMTKSDTPSILLDQLRKRLGGS